MERPAPLPSSRLLLSAYPCRLPHVEVADGEVWFGGLRDAAVGDAEREFLQLADGRTPFSEMLAVRPQLLAAAGSSRYAVWLAAPLEAPPQPAAGERCLLLGAHPGDVELSMAGFVLHRRGTAAFTLLSCFSRQLETRVPGCFPGRRQVSAIRRDEACLAASVLGAEARFLGLPEYVLRQDGAGAERMTLPGPELEAALRTALHDTLAEIAPSQVYAPAALGNHPDQRMIFDAVLELYEEDAFPGTEYHLYENFPLAASYLHVDDFLSRFEGSYLQPEPWFEEADGALAEKLALAEIFRSRFDLGSRRLLLDTARRDARLERREGGAAERFWSLRDAALFG